MNFKSLIISTGCFVGLTDVIEDFSLLQRHILRETFFLTYFIINETRIRKQNLRIVCSNTKCQESEQLLLD